MKLIDADDFMKILLSVKRINKGFPLLDDDQEINNYDVGQEETFDLIIRKLSEQPTAYDVEKVVDQLEEKVELAYRRYMDCPPNSPCFSRYRTQYEERKMCLEIVKGGGVNDD